MAATRSPGRSSAGASAPRAPTVSGSPPASAPFRPGWTNDERTERIEKIKTEERTRRMRHAVAGFDYTFNPAKSVSVLWAVADRDVREQITAAHHAAIHDMLALLERDVARTRVGTDGVAQRPVRGVRRRGVRPLRLPRARPAAAHPRRGRQPGPSRGWALADPGLPWVDLPFGGRACPRPTTTCWPTS